MAYDEVTAERVRKVLRGRKGLSERKMFGGVAFLLNGNMFCGVLRKDIMLRLGEKGTDQALRDRHTCPMDFTGNRSKRWSISVPPDTGPRTIFGGGFDARSISRRASLRK